MSASNFNAWKLYPHKLEVPPPRRRRQFTSSTRCADRTAGSRRSVACSPNTACRSPRARTAIEVGTTIGPHDIRRLSHRHDPRSGRALRPPQDVSQPAQKGPQRGCLHNRPPHGRRGYGRRASEANGTEPRSRAARTPHGPLTSSTVTHIRGLESEMGHRLHVHQNVGGVRLRRVRHRLLLPSDRRLAMPRRSRTPRWSPQR